MKGHVDFEGIEWQETPQPGIFVYCIEEIRRDGERVPISTSHAVKLDPGFEIGLHYHRRERE